MRILSNAPKRLKIELPKGSINVRFRQMRGVYQVFAGRNYLTGASGETAEEAIEQLKRLYDVPADAKIKIH